MKALGPLANYESEFDRNSQGWMKALGPLAVADRDILARSSAPRRTREN